MRASFKIAIAWLAYNDDCAWLYEEDWVASDAACLVADLFGKDPAFVRSQVKRFREREGLGDAR